MKLKEVPLGVLPVPELFQICCSSMCAGLIPHIVFGHRGQYVCYAMVGKIFLIFWQLQHYNTLNVLMVVRSVSNVPSLKKAPR